MIENDELESALFEAEAHPKTSKTVVFDSTLFSRNGATNASNQRDTTHDYRVYACGGAVERLKQYIEDKCNVYYCYCCPEDECCCALCNVLVAAALLPILGTLLVPILGPLILLYWISSALGCDECFKYVLLFFIACLIIGVIGWLLGSMFPALFPGV